MCDDMKPLLERIGCKSGPAIPTPIASRSVMWRETYNDSNDDEEQATKTGIKPLARKKFLRHCQYFAHLTRQFVGNKFRHIAIGPYTGGMRLICGTGKGRMNQDRKSVV